MLKRRLFDEYGGFADKRIKNLGKDTRFQIDDRKESDHGSDGLYSYFCAIHAEVDRPEPMTPEELTVSLTGSVPTSAAVQAWVKEQGVESRDGLLRFPVPRGDQSKLRSLAKEIRSIVAPGAPWYAEASYMHMCPRTATSLERLAGILDDVWSKR